MCLRPSVIGLLLAGATFHGASAAPVQSFGALEPPRYEAAAPRLNHVNPAARPGGEITLPAFGAFDTLNPYTIKGVSLSFASDQRVWGIDALNETLMVGGAEYLSSPDESLTAYCLVCDSVEWREDTTTVRFTLRRDARFHDGSPITSEDVIASYRLLTGPDAHPRFADGWRDVKALASDGPHAVVFQMKPGTPAASVLRLGDLPVMSSRFWSGRTFGEPLLEPPLLSGPYRVASVDHGRRITLAKVHDHWSRQHFYYRHRFNFEKVHYDFFRDRNVAFEAFKSGKLDAWYEYVARNWATGYDFPAIRDGRIRRDMPEHDIPVSYQFFSLNLRRAPFNDAAFREALTHAFDFEWTNRFLFNGAYQRATSYFPNSRFDQSKVPLSPHARELARSIGLDTDAWAAPVALPTTDGSGHDRRPLTHAARVLKAAGYTLREGRLVSPAGTAVRFEFLIDQPSLSRVIQPYRRNLKRLGIETELRLIDTSQYKFRLDRHDYDVTIISWPQAMVPGQELRSYLHSTQANKTGGFNFPGMMDPDVDRLVDSLAAATTLEDISAWSALLDRALLKGHYTIPHWFLGHHRIAYNAKLVPVAPPRYSLDFAGWWLSTDGRSAP